MLTKTYNWNSEWYADCHLLFLPVASDEEEWSNLYSVIELSIIPTDSAPMFVKNVRKKLRLHLQNKWIVRGNGLYADRAVMYTDILYVCAQIAWIHCLYFSPFFSFYGMLRDWLAVVDASMAAFNNHFSEVFYFFILYLNCTCVALPLGGANILSWTMDSISGLWIWSLFNYDYWKAIDGHKFVCKFMHLLLSNQLISWQW